MHFLSPRRHNYAVTVHGISLSGFLFALIVLLEKMECAYACHINQFSTCANNIEVSNALTAVIPMPNPSNLDQECINLNSSLRCILSDSVLGLCSDVTTRPYRAFDEVLRIPCHEAKKEYLAGSKCWIRPDKVNLNKNCYLRSSRKIQSNFCSGASDFISCVINGTASKNECKKSDLKMISNMLTKWYNFIGIATNPKCPHLPFSTVPETSTTNTTSTTESTKVLETSPSTTRNVEENVSRTTSKLEMNSSDSFKSRSSTNNSANRAASLVWSTIPLLMALHIFYISVSSHKYYFWFTNVMKRVFIFSLNNLTKYSV